MPPVPLPAPEAGSSDVRELILSVFEQSLQAQLSAVRRLKVGKAPPDQLDAGRKGRRRSGRSQVDLAYDILAKARAPLHISALLEQIQATFGRSIDSESLVSALSKRVARKDRFVRPKPNTFGLRKS
jgi:hypothetical protein